MSLRQKKVNNTRIRTMEKETKTKVEDVNLNEVLPANTEILEPILKDNPNRFVLFPIQHMDIWEMYIWGYQLLCISRVLFEMKR